MDEEPQRLPVRAFIGLGSNIGDRCATLRSARAALDELPGTTTIAFSPMIETEAVVRPGAPPQAPYLNAAAQLETSLGPRALLDALLDIERDRGRDRADAERWTPRTLDLDLLLYGEQIINEPGLTVPHPHMHEREFVLAPLASIAPDALHPVLKRTVGEMLESVRSRSGASMPESGSPG
ncbi:MAG: 2-amino-4-hydroxy-6-hydroxymethyldihydropteridine diphosphokinase [Phycisphaeraceae bacterium]|nr:MAG: 2-amino-4-hydroxy-6-hydroxymethyldihydropteridine diphosphokinase [Phycisphaeraceae bacterium]